MKTLLLLRHAKSSWTDPQLNDFDRPLARRGRIAASAVGRYLAEAGLVPDLIICSAAQRTRETLALLLPSLPGEMRVEVETGLYEADPQDILDRVQRIADGVERVLVVGHNPGMEQLADELTASGDESARSRMAEKFPTAALAVITFDAKRWADVRPGTGTLRRFVVQPRSD